MAQASRDQNRVTTLLGVSNVDGTTPVAIYADPVTHRLLVDLSGGAGTVTDVSVVTANGFAGSVANSTTTPAITLQATPVGILQSNGTSMSAITVGSGLSFAGGTLSATGVAGSIVVGTTTITSGTTTRILYDNAGVLGEYTLTGTGTVVAMQTNPTLSGMTMTDATNIVLNTTTGTKIGTATSQKLGFYNATPIIQPSGDVATALSNLGLVATPTVTATNITVANEASDTTCFPIFVTAATGDLPPKSNTGLTFNSSTASLGATLMTATTSLTTATVRASSNDSGSLGASGTAFSDLFLASGALIDFAAGNSVITHSSGILTVSTGDLRVTTAGTNSASVVTVGGTQTLTNKIVSHTFEPASDDTYTGDILTGFNAGDTVAQWDCIYLASDGKWDRTDADAAATAGGVMVGMAAAASTDTNPVTVILKGVVRNDGWTWATVGAPLYLDTATAGGMTLTAPSGTDDVVRIVGYVLSDDCIYFNPSNDWITRT